MSWPILLLACLGCYALKVFGAVLPRRYLDHPLVREAAPLVPVALLVGLIVVNSLASGRHVQPDARLAGMAVAFAGVLAKVPFLAVVVLAAATTALVRAVA